MKFSRYLIFLFLLPLLAHSQAGEWTWMGGDTGANIYNYNYGTMGVPSSANQPPALYAPGFWTDTAGNLWVYGGIFQGISVVGALWKFDPDLVLWTWVNGDTGAFSQPNFANLSGVFDPANDPGPQGFGIATWTDKQNHLWMYGGWESANGQGNDLWQYDPAINQWAWMTGTQDLGLPAVYGTEGLASAANTPGGRYETNSTWMDGAGNLWFFGGYDGSSDYNDMWEYDISANMWIWMSGSNNPEDSGSYGPIGTASVNYYPSARSCNLHWQDNSGNFWLIGGGDFAGNINTITTYIDVWKFNPSSLEWTLVKGSAQPYDTINIASANCQANAGNQQGGRYENRAMWKLSDCIIINYGGLYGNSDFLSSYNDLWAFLPQLNEWVEINESNYAGNYGTEGLASAQNYPPQRQGSVAFMDKINNIWMFGGTDWTNNIYYNDLWKYVLDTSCIGSMVCIQNCNLSNPNITSNTDTICPSDSTQICAPSTFSSYAWNPATGGATGNCIEATDAGDYYVTVTDNNGCTAESNHIGITVLQSPPISISGSGDTLRVYNATNVQWYLNNYPINGATQNIYIAQAFGSYTVSVTDSNGCTTFSSPVDYTGITDISEDDNVSIYPNPLSVGSWQLAVVREDSFGGKNMVGSEIEILDAEGRVVYKSEIRATHSEIETPFAGGVYLLRIVTGTGMVVRKLVKL